MRILILADNFTPEIAATSFRTHEHAKVWLGQGHEVTVVTCAPNWPRGRVFNGFQNRLYQVEWMDGIRVIRIWSYISANAGLFKRTLDYLSFMFSAVLLCWRFPRFDVVMATSPQFFTAVAGWLIASLRRRPWVLEVRDLWPESIRAVGICKTRILHLLERVELFLYRRADRVIVVTRAFRENLIKRGIDGGKIDVITNGVDPDAFSPRVPGCRQAWGISEEKFLVGYVGTTGLAHGLETLLYAAQRCGSQKEIQFLIIGDGARHDELRALAEREQIDNVKFLRSVPHSQIPACLTAFDLSIIHLRPDPVFHSVIPSKLFECMAAGRPVLHAVEGESAEIVREAACGVCIVPGDPDAMAETILALHSEPEKLQRMGRQGRYAAETHFNRREKAEAALASLELATPGHQSLRDAARRRQQISAADQPSVSVDQRDGCSVRERAA